MKFIYKYTIIFALILSVISLKAQINSGTTSIGSGATQMDMTITVNSNNSTVSFSITGPASRWFGFGFAASSMSSGAYTILANVSSGNPMEYNQVNHSAPNLQTTQNLSSITSSTNGGFKTYTFTRPMNTNDANDFVFLSTTTSINLIWAYGNSTSMSQHAGRGTASITLTNACNIPTTNLPPISICAGDSAMIFGNYVNQAGTYYDSLTTTIGCDSVITQSLVVNQSSSNTIDTTICSGDSIMIFGNWISQQGLYTDTTQSSLGCDSIINYNVSTILIDTTVYISNNTLNAAFAFANSYQWYDCQTNQAISGATSMTYSPTQNGNYKVEIFTSYCSRMSSCHSINWVGIETIENNSIKITPNPVEDNLFINIVDNTTIYKITILSIDGRIILEQNLNSNMNALNLSTLQSGMYIYKIESLEGKIKSNRFIKK
jgi:hypothetical protein